MKEGRIAFVSLQSPFDRRSWSGSLAFMFDTLTRMRSNVEWVNPGYPYEMHPGSLFNKIARKTIGQGYDYLHSVTLSRIEGRKLERLLKRGRFDLVFAPAAATQIAFAEISVPIVYLSDATYAQLHGYYDFFADLLPWSARSGELIEQRALVRATAVVYSTTWASTAALAHYGVDQQRVHVIPFGANLTQTPTRDEAIARSLGDRCRLLFIGLNWERKGGAIAVETLHALATLGIEAELTVVGCVPPPQFREDRIRVIPFLDKNDPEEMKELTDLLMGSDFLLLPTRAEAAGIAFAEASAFGLPTLTTRTGGVPDVVVDGENGLLLDLDASGDAYARLIAGFFQHPDRYSALVRSSRDSFETRLNWDLWGKRIGAVMDGVLHSKERR